MGSIQFPEIVIILLLALLLFGPKKLPEIGRTLGSAMRELRKAAQEFSTSVEQLDKDIDLTTDDTEKE
ncbi:MAG: twin-arginine translocase TatA/TatE family subunit [Armatimonadetes bacterium]|nr:twin-arginine translocase TatA/TatE family subunit [Armatimonadota bacterium]